MMCELTEAFRELTECYRKLTSRCTSCELTEGVSSRKLTYIRMSLSLSMRRSLAYRLREAGVTESAARVLARQPAPVPEDPDRAFDAPESG